MKRSRFREQQIIGILKEHQVGATADDLCRKRGVSDATLYKWRSKYGGMAASLMVRMKELDAENTRLKKMYAEKSMQNDLLKEALGKKW